MIPDLSIITVNHNNRSGLLKTIESAINQTFKNYEYIIIDGASTDGSAELIKEYSDRIYYWVSERDSGIYNAMNKGIKRANGEYLLFLNSGDKLINKNILGEVFKEDHKEDIIYGDITYFDPVKKKMLKPCLPEKPDLYFFYKQSLWHQAAFIKRKLFTKYGDYNENNKLVSDWEYFLKRIVIDKCSYKKINKIITNYDMFNGISVTNNEIRIKEMKNIMLQTFPSYIIELLENYSSTENEIRIFRKSIFYKLYRKYKKLLNHN